MVLDILNNLELSGKMAECEIVISVEDHNEVILGGDVLKVNKAGMSYTGGESGYERFEVPLEKIIEIRRGKEVIYRRKKYIDRIYPKG
jgi:uncharacterized protein (UPF0248 family)